MPRSASAAHGRGREPVAVLEAVGQVPVDLAAELAQRRDEDRRRADAVAVVVAVDRDPRAARDVAEHELDGRRRCRGTRRGGARLDASRNSRAASGSAEPAPRQHLREHAARRRARARASRPPRARAGESRAAGCRRPSSGEPTCRVGRNAGAQGPLRRGAWVPTMTSRSPSPARRRPSGSKSSPRSKRTSSSETPKRFSSDSRLRSASATTAR